MVFKKYHIILVYVCMHAYIVVCVCVPAHVHVCLQVKTRGQLRNLYQSFSTLIFWAESFIESDQISCPVNPRYLAVSASLSLELHECKAACRLWGLNLGPHAALSSILPTKLSLHLFPLYFSVVELCYQFTPHIWGYPHMKPSFLRVLLYASHGWNHGCALTCLIFT